MQCPKCHFEHPLQTSECLRCGLVFAKYAAEDAAVAPAPIVEPPLSAEAVAALQAKERHELMCRVFGLPGALLVGWLAVKITPTLAAFLQMWTHETGHALAAWLCGYVAIPTAWITIRFGERERVVSLLLAVGVSFGGYVAWRLERWFWVVASAAVVLLLLAGNMRTSFQADALFTFGGDAGSFVVATLLMATFYARPESAMRRNQLRWGLLLIGAIAFMATYATWSGGFEKIVHWIDDLDERGPSDLMQLTQLYGWTIGEMQARFLRVAHLCFVALAAMYAAGIVQTMQRIKALAAEARPAALARALGSNS
jgi:hypothetical protein